jgi:hypothetical protein
VPILAPEAWLSGYRQYLERSERFGDDGGMAVTTGAHQPPHATPQQPRQPGKVRRTELGTFLRSRRERLSPENVGLPTSVRRRTPGLRREEVAQLAGVGVTWYTWLEQGRPINASTQVLNALARTLKLDREEHNHLYRLAGVPAVVPPGEREAVLEPEVYLVLAEINSIACVLNERFDLLAWNRAYESIFPAVRHDHGKYRNAMWCVFTSEGCCHPYVNRAEEMPRMVATLRAGYAHHVGEPSWEMFIRDLLEASPAFAGLWARHEVAGYDTRRKIFLHPEGGQLRFKSLSMGIHASPGARMVVYTPADDATEKALRTLHASPTQFTKHAPQCSHSMPPAAVTSGE